MRLIKRIKGMVRNYTTFYIILTCGTMRRLHIHKKTKMAREVGLENEKQTEINK